MDSNQQRLTLAAGVAQAGMARPMIRTFTINGAPVHECPAAVLREAAELLGEQLQHLERVARQACPRSAPCAAPTCADYPHCDAPREVRTCRR